jgi:hypothetical protein
MLHFGLLVVYYSHFLLHTFSFLLSLRVLCKRPCRSFALTQSPISVGVHSARHYPCIALTINQRVAARQQCDRGPGQGPTGCTKIITPWLCYRHCFASWNRSAVRCIADASYPFCRHHQGEKFIQWFLQICLLNVQTVGLYRCLRNEYKWC